MRTGIKIFLLTHRYLGLVLSALFLSWFLSGFVMMYKDFPNLSTKEKFERSSPIRFRPDPLQPHQAVPLAQLPGHLNSLSIASILQWPVYRLQDDEGNTKTIFTDNGRPLQQLDRYHAVCIAKEFLGGDVKIKRAMLTDRLDQWTPRTRFLPHMPLHKIYIDDSEQTVLYISSTTGEVVQKLNFSDKVWAWLGAIPHWIYFRDLRIHTQAWRNVVIGVSLVGTIMCLAGLVLGIQRYVKARKHKRITPYKKIWFRWHHLLGFVFGLFVFTWIMSGLFSMNPWHWSPESELTETERQRWQGGDFQIDSTFADIKQITEHLAAHGKVKELELIWVAQQPFWLARYEDSQTKLLAANDPHAIPLDSLPKKHLVRLAQKLKPESAMQEVAWLTDYDSYYYNKSRTRTLPVIRIKMADTANTWYYIDPKTSTVVKKNETASRAERWVYNGLHSLDFPVLFFKRPLWDIVVIFFLLGGTASCVTSLALTLKWMKRKSSITPFSKKKIQHERA
jgi:hypothetical protein